MALTVVVPLFSRIWTLKLELGPKVWLAGDKYIVAEPLPAALARCIAANTGKAAASAALPNRLIFDMYFIFSLI
jgi:hypothetical protein